MANILLVDDRPENLLALEGILEPLQQTLLYAQSGEDALRQLLLHDVALILLDVQMPELDGFETAALIKQRERTRHIPIIFVTAISKDEQQVFRGYSAGAVDYVFKPFSPEVLRSKVSVFIELYDKTEQLRRQAELLKEQELAELRRESEERYRFLAEAQPDQIWTALPNGKLDYENELRFRRAADGSYRWHLTRAVPMTNRRREVVKWFGSNIDIDDQKRAEEAQRFLVEAGAALGSSLDHRSTLAAVAKLAVPRIADWARVDILEEGRLRTIAVEHVDPRKVELGLVRELGFQSYMCVPLVARGSVIGVISFVAAESGRRFGPEDLALAEELARRTSTAVENAQLYREVEERAQAARVLETVGDGVFLVDREGVVRLWNKAAEAITGVSRNDVPGRRAVAVLPGWDDVGARVPVAGAPGPAVAETLPLELAGRERWLSISGVGFEEGTVYAFRDITEERALERIRQDLVATVSHELRTPLAAIYGSALTLARDDLELEEAIGAKLLEVIIEESARLADIVNDLLIASQLDAGRMEVRVERCDASVLTKGVVDAAATHLPDGVTLRLEPVGDDLPPVVADEGQLRQVLDNLIDNAFKYSPDGGEVRIRVEPADEYVRFAVSDEGLGIPRPEEARISEKFYRLDPHMARGIGGTGLGLYIARELVRRVSGRIWVEPNNGRGSVFYVEIPAASGAETGGKPRETARASA